jgi:glucosyl-3-phosphoglycerate synthase
MEYVQERIATLHDLTDAVPDAPLDRTAVVVPMTHRDYASLAAERIFDTLGDLSPATVVVPLRAPPDSVDSVREWLADLDVDTELLWCNGPEVRALLSAHELDTSTGKGSDVWLALGRAAERADYVVLHDADATTYSAAHVPRLCAPLTDGFSFTKGYYARVENHHLYGRLFRLFYAPLVRVLDDAHDATITRYLDSFRYALAGEFGLTADLARRIRAQRSWGLEVGTLGEAYQHAGVDGTAQVDLGIHQHDHRSVGGPTGLAEMCREVADALFLALEDAGVSPTYETLATRYRQAAESLLDGYAADALFNGLSYDRADEREQVGAYADAISPPRTDSRLPAWVDVSIDPGEVVAASERSIAGCSADGPRSLSGGESQFSP